MGTDISLSSSSKPLLESDVPPHTRRAPESLDSMRELQNILLNQGLGTLISDHFTNIAGRIQLPRPSTKVHDSFSFEPEPSISLSHEISKEAGSSCLSPTLQSSISIP